MGYPWPDWTANEWEERLGLRTAENIALRPATPVQEAADAHVGSLQTALLYAFALVKHAVHLPALNLALDSGNKMAIDAALMDVPANLEAALMRVLPNALYHVFLDGGRAGITMLVPMRAAEFRAAAPRRPGLRFNIIDPRAIAWAQQWAADLVKGIVQTTRDAIAEAVTSGLSGEQSRREVIADIMDAIGDAARARLIAHTETMRAANAGLAHGWQQAREKGWLTGDNKKRWIAAGDGPPPYGSTCPICLGLDGETVKLSQSFSIGADPPAHPSCRCTMGIVG